MLHAIKPMIWQALQTLKESDEDRVKRSKLQVLSHNLSAEGILVEVLKSLDACFPPETEKVDCKMFLDKVIHEAVGALSAKSEKDQKICVERVHHVCWELCKVQLKGALPSMLTAESTKIWWKIFTTFAQRDSENEGILYPVTMDWEEVDYWANVVLKVMALPTVSPSRKEREVMGATSLNFQDALGRFNGKLNHNNGMYVLNSKGQPDLEYMENAMQELNVRLFEGIHLNGFLLPVKKNHTQHPKWCVLYQLGMAFADNPADVDSSNPKAFIRIGSGTEVTPIYDKNQRPVRFQLKNAQDASPLIFEANNISVRNKWVTAIICLKHGKLPDYEKDFVNRCKTRLRNRQFEREAKETLRMQKERTKKQVEEMSQAMEAERERLEQEAESVRNASADQLREKIVEYDRRQDALMRQMRELGQQYELEKAAITEQHERELAQLAREHGNQMGSVQNEWESEVARLRGVIDAERTSHEEEIRQKNSRITELEQEVARLSDQLASLTKQKEESAMRHQSQAEEAAAKLTAEKENGARLREECDQLSKEATQLRDRIQGLEELQESWEADREELDRLKDENVELNKKADQLEARVARSRKPVVSEISEEDELLREAIFQQTGFSRRDEILHDDLNDVNFQSAGGSDAAASEITEN